MAPETRQSAPGADYLQLDAAEPRSAESAVPTCARCTTEIRTSYHEANGAVICGRCRIALETERGGSGSRSGRLLRALVFGLGGAVIGAAIYYAILALTGYEIGLVAVVVGFIVGRAVHIGARGRGGWAYQTLAIGLTYSAIVSTHIPLIRKQLHEQRPAATVSSGVATPGAASDSARLADSTAAAAIAAVPTVVRWAIGLSVLFVIAALMPILAGVENIVGLLIIGFALFEAWRVNKREPLLITGPYQVAVAGGAPGSRGA